MSDDKIVINCIVPTNEMSFRCSIETTETILRDVLRVISMQLGCFVPQFTKMIKEELDLRNENQYHTRVSNSIHCSFIFDLIEEPKFWRFLRKLANGYETCINIHLVKVCLYLYYVKRVGIDLLSGYFNTYVILDTESMHNGAAQNPQLLFRSFTMMNRYFPKEFILLWLSHNKEMLSGTKTLAPDEYIILASNTFNKQKLIEEKIPKVRMHNKKDPKTGVYLIDDFSHKPDFDFKLDQIMLNYKAENIIFDYTYKPTSLIFDKNPQGRKKMLKMLETKSLKDFQTCLRDPVLIKKLRETLNTASNLLTRTRINSDHFSYLNHRNSTGFINGVTSIVKPSRTEFDDARPETGGSRISRTRPQTSRTVPVRPQSCVSIQQKLIRPQTSIPSKGKTKSSALDIGVKNEPYHVMTLRESASLYSLG